MFRCLHWQKVAANVECGVRKEMALYLSHKFLVKTKLFNFQLLKIHFVLGVFLIYTKFKSVEDLLPLFQIETYISTSLLKKHVCTETTEKTFGIIFRCLFSVRVTSSWRLGRTNQAKSGKVLAPYIYIQRYIYIYTLSYNKA